MLHFMEYLNYKNIDKEEIFLDTNIYDKNIVCEFCFEDVICYTEYNSKFQGRCEEHNECYFCNNKILYRMLLQSKISGTFQKYDVCEKHSIRGQILVDYIYF